MSRSLRALISGRAPWFDYVICPRNGDSTSAFVKWCRAVDKYDRMAQSDRTINSLFRNLLRVCAASYPMRNIKQIEWTLRLRLQWHSDTYSALFVIQLRSKVLYTPYLTTRSETSSRRSLPPSPVSFKSACILAVIQKIANNRHELGRFASETTMNNRRNLITSGAPARARGILRINLKCDEGQVIRLIEIAHPSSLSSPISRRARSAAWVFSFRTSPDWRQRSLR